jgi:hypothetical protein
VRGQTVAAPLVFYPKDGVEAYELVVTRVNPRDVVGYVLVPSDSRAGGTDAAVNRKPARQPASGGM